MTPRQDREQDWQRDWQEAWHRVLDAELGPDPQAGAEGARPEPDCDFRLQFETWTLSEAGLRQCFGLLPQGAALAARALEMRARLQSGAEPPLSDAEALALLASGLAGLALHVDTDFGQVDPLRIIRGDQQRLLEVFQSADAPTIDLDDRLSELAAAHSGPEGRAAYFFLGEILYRLASDYAVAHWIAWPLCHDPAASDPYRNFARLSGQGFYPGLDGEGVFLFVEESCSWRSTKKNDYRITFWHVLKFMSGCSYYSMLDVSR